MNRITYTLVKGVCIVALLGAVGCASTLKPGQWVHVPVTTNPPGATLAVAGFTYTSPAVVWVPRGLGDFKLSIFKEGYKPAHVFLRQSPDRALWGDLGFGPFGFMVDMMTGAAYDVEPEVVDFVLTPEAAS